MTAQVPHHPHRWSLPQPAHLDWEKLMHNQHKELERLSTLYQKGLEGAGVKFFEARARITGPHSVEVAGPSFKVCCALVAAWQLWCQNISQCCAWASADSQMSRPHSVEVAGRSVKVVWHALLAAWLVHDVDMISSASGCMTNDTCAQQVLEALQVC